MAGINVRRWLAGGVVAGIVLWLLEGLASTFYIAEMNAALEAMGLVMEMDAAVWLLSVLVSLLVGLTGVFLYAAVRPRFGPGPRTAVLVAVALWLGGYLTSLVGYHMMGMFPPGLLVTWGAVSLVEMVLALVAGAWVYREG